jgi:hypothetical protein
LRSQPRTRRTAYDFFASVPCERKSADAEFSSLPASRQHFNVWRFAAADKTSFRWVRREQGALRPSFEP